MSQNHEVAKALAEREKGLKIIAERGKANEEQRKARLAGIEQGARIAWRAYRYAALAKSS